MTEHIDLDALRELQVVMGDEFSLLVETFVNDSIVRLEGIKAAVSAGDTKAIRRAAHNFKGSAGNMAAIQLAELCRAMEALGHQGSTVGCEQLLADIEAEYTQVQAVLTSF